MGLMHSFYSTKYVPNPDNTIDLGSSSLEFKDLYIDGLAYLDGLGQDLDSGNYKILFRDAAIYIQSIDDGHLDLVADVSIDLNGLIVAVGDHTGYSGSQANTHLSLRGSTTGTKELTLGVDTTNNQGFIQARNFGIDYYELLLQPLGGNTTIGAAAYSTYLKGSTNLTTLNAVSYNDEPVFINDDMVFI